MALSLVHDTGLHHFEVFTDKSGHNPYLKCWCNKRHTLDFTWGIRRFTRGLSSFLQEHENCQPIGDKQPPVPKYQRGQRVSCATQGITFSGRIAQFTVTPSTVVYHIEAETPNKRTTPVFVEEYEITGLAPQEEEGTP